MNASVIIKPITGRKALEEASRFTRRLPKLMATVEDRIGQTLHLEVDLQLVMDELKRLEDEAVYSRQRAEHWRTRYEKIEAQATVWGFQWPL